MKDLLHLNYPKTLEEKRIIIVAFWCFTLLEFGVFFTILRDHGLFSTFIAISSIIALTFFFILASIRIYEFYIYFRAEYVLYIVQCEDTLLGISQRFLPECNPWRTAAIIKYKNNINGSIIMGEKLLIPIRK